jgi:predicted nucleic acid-binding protein
MTVKAVLDTNIVLDALMDRAPFALAAQRILLLAAQERVDAFVTANTVTDLYYVVRRHLSDAEARAAFRTLFRAVHILDLLAKDCMTALDSPLSDFEDAVLVACARRSRSDFIVTRDSRLLAASQTDAIITPDALLEVVG